MVSFSRFKLLYIKLISLSINRSMLYSAKKVDGNMSFMRII